jgi:hypothetical protein
MTGVSTPMAGICSRTGTERPRECVDFAGDREEDDGVLAGCPVVARSAW